MFEKMVKSRNKKGFTLMEMLIVIAIIAILIAIATPVMMGQLKKAKAVADAANLSNANSIAAVFILNSKTDIKTIAVDNKSDLYKEITETNKIPTNSTLDGGDLTITNTDGDIVCKYGTHDKFYYQDIAQGGDGTP